jgi:hypothetical protein
MNITINQEQRLFVLNQDCGYSCLGFDVVYGYCKELTNKIKQYRILKSDEEIPPLLESEIGTLQQYSHYEQLLNLVKGKKIGTFYNADTPKKVRNVLENCREEGTKIRLFYGSTITGRSWMDENDVLGTVGRSNGTMQIPLLIEEGEHGGGGILDNCILRIIDANTRQELYRHKLFHVPEMEIRTVDDKLKSEGYTHGVWVKSETEIFENYANCKSMGKAAQYVAFMEGECTEQPN